MAVKHVLIYFSVCFFFHVIYPTEESGNISECDNAAFQKRCCGNVSEQGDKESRDQQERHSAREYVRELIRALPG